MQLTDLGLTCSLENTAAFHNAVMLEAAVGLDPSRQGFRQIDPLQAPVVSTGIGYVER